MAIKALDVRPVPKGADGVADPDCHIGVWEGFAATDTGAPYIEPGRADRSVQVVDLAGGSIFIEGGNDGVNFHTLTDGNGNDLEFTANGVKSVYEVVVYLRPRAGAGVTTGDVYLLARRPTR